MKRFGTTLALAAFLLVAQLALAAPPALEIPAEVKPSGQYVRLTPKTDGVSVTYVGLSGVDPFPSEELKDARRFLLDTKGLSKGRYNFAAVAAGKDGEQTRADFTVVIGDAPAPPVPQPPNPPTPGGAVARVLVVYESADLPKLPAAQQAVIYGKAVRDRLDALTPLGPDGKTHEWRMWDKDTDASAEVPAWGQLLRRERKSLPWVVIASDAGPLYEGPLPANAADMAELLDRYTKKGK